MLRDGRFVYGVKGSAGCGYSASTRGRLFRLLLLAAFVAVALWTNPGWHEDSFFKFVRSQRKFALAQRMFESIGLVKHNDRVYNLAVASVGACDTGVYFVGVFDIWIELGWAERRDVDILLVGYLAIALFWRLKPQVAARHCVASWAAFRRGRVWTLLIAQLSHAHVGHLLGNIVFLYSVAPHVHDQVTRRNFFLLYFLGGCCSILTSLAISPYAHRGLPPAECVGASGSLFALLGYLARSGNSLGWLGREWDWMKFALAQLLLCFHLGGVDGVSHVVGLAFGWVAAHRRIW